MRAKVVAQRNEELSISCIRKLPETEPLPFVGMSRGAMDFHVEPVAVSLGLIRESLLFGLAKTLGIEFCEAAEIPSPHIRRTHVETSYHVRGQHGGKQLAEILQAVPAYRGRLLFNRVSGLSHKKR